VNGGKREERLSVTVAIVDNELENSEEVGAIDLTMHPRLTKSDVPLRRHSLPEVGIDHAESPMRTIAITWP